MTARVGRRGLTETQPLAHWCLLSQDLSLPPQQGCCLNLSKQIGKFYKNWFMMLTFVRHPEAGKRMLSEKPIESQQEKCSEAFRQRGF